MKSLRIAAVVLATAFSIASYAQPLFTESATSSGVDHLKPVGLFGSGISCYDFDQDGLDDLTVGTDAGDSLFFYRNTGSGFTLLEPPPVLHLGEAKQVLWADYDNDGDPDLFVTDRVGTDRLYRNEGALVFIDVTAAVGLPLDTIGDSFGAAWADYDRDGLLDLYVCSRGAVYPAHRNRLYRNTGGLFQDVTVTAGLEDSAKQTFCATFLDYDGDQWPDVYEANDKADLNTLLRNLGGGGFENTSLSSNSAVRIQAMCVTVGDYDADGDQDIYVTNGPDGNVLLRNDSDGTFTEVANTCGVAFNSVGWASNWLDADNDGHLDLYVSGSLVGHGAGLSSAFYHNNGDGTFSIPSGIGLDADTVMSFANATGDFNGDGFPDIVTCNATPFPLQLWENNGGAGHWVKLDLRGTASNREGLGAWIDCYAGGRRLVRYTHSAIGYLGQNSKQVHIGLGSVDVIDSLLITWPSGHVDRYLGLCVDRVLQIAEGHPAPQPFEGASSFGLCPGTTIELDPGAFSGYAWSGGETTPTLTVTAPGSYGLTVTDGVGLCASVEVDVFEWDAPSVIGFSTTPDGGSSPSGTATAGVSGGTPPYSFQWDDPLGQTGQTAVTLSEGSYTVTVTDANGCAITATVDIERITAIAEASWIGNLTVYPVPARERALVDFGEALIEDIMLELVDMQGRVVLRQEVMAGQREVTLSREDRPAGLYRMTLKNGQLSQSLILAFH